MCTILQALKDPTPLLKAASTALALKTKASVKDRSKVRPQDLNNKVTNCALIGGLFKVTLVVGFAFLPEIFGKVAGTCEGDLLFCKCRWSGVDTETSQTFLMPKWSQELVGTF